MPPRTVSDDFKQYSDERVTQPSVGGVIKYPTVEYSKAAAATTMRASGIGMQRGGKSLQKAGKGMTKAGMALSRTGVGAVVGVPLMAIGGATQAAGAATKVAGTTARQSGRAMQNKQRAIGGAFKGRAINPAEKLKDTIKSTRTFFWIMSWATPVWFLLQLPLAILTVVTFGAAEAAASVLPEWIVEWAADDLLIILPNAVFFIGMMTLIVMAGIYIMSGIKCFFGEGSHFKVPAFCLAVVFYLLPFVSVFPWFMLWAFAVWRYPK